MLAAFLAAYLLGNNRMPLFDRDEGWYAEVARNMAAGGNWIVPHFGGQVFSDKPVFAFWLQAASMRLFGLTAFAARLPSAICSVLTLVLVWWAVRRFAGPTRALWTVAVLGSGALFMGLSKFVLVDSVLLLTITAAQICLAALYGGRRSIGVAIAFWISCGLAVLTKGPVVFGMIGGTAIALAIMDVGRQFASLKAWKRATAWWWSTRPLLGIVILALVLGPWVIAVFLSDRKFVPVMLAHILGPIFQRPLNSRRTMFGFYLVTIWPMFMPWSFLLPMALVHGWKNRRLAPVRFCFAATVGSLLVLELVKQKLLHYLLPLSPALSFLMADVIVRTIRKQVRDLSMPLARIGLWIWAACIVGAGIAPWALARNGAILSYSALALLTAIGFVSVIIVMRLFTRENYRAAFATICATSVTIMAIIAAVVVPSLGPMLGGKSAAAAMYQAGYKPGQDVAMIGYTEPSLIFYLDGGGVTWHESTLASAQHPPMWLVTTETFRAQMPESASAAFVDIGRFPCWTTGSVKGKAQIVVMKRSPGVTNAPSIASSTPATKSPQAEPNE